MSRRDDRVSLLDMLNHAREAVDLLGGASPDDLGEDRILELALRKLVEIVGEAASRVSKPTRQLYNGIPWPQIVGMRNRLVHGYDDISLDRLWDTINDELPSLIAQLESIVKE